ncbi:cobalamin biosynthesis protein [Streptomyces sp. NPDC093546]|uniref:cobalamin biosynthesis protein n=1 Tax=Streptomyces sp. NPDC093546 TaxID=3366040 RepID=UPI00382AE286
MTWLVVVGVGAGRGVSADAVLGLIEETLREAGLPVGEVAEVATLDTKADEPGVVAAAARLGVPLRGYAARELARVAVPHPSDAVRGAVGTSSVAEAAALAGGGELLVPKRKAAGRPARVTCAVARRRLLNVVPGYTGGETALTARPAPESLDRERTGSPSTP